MQCFVTILVRNDDTFEAIFGNKNRLCATFLPRNKVKCISFVYQACWQEVRDGAVLSVICDVQKNPIRIWNKVLFHKNWIFKWISSLQKCFLELSLRDIYTLTLDARNAYILSVEIFRKYSEFLRSPGIVARPMNYLEVKVAIMAPRIAPISK